MATGRARLRQKLDRRFNEVEALARRSHTPPASTRNRSSVRAPLLQPVDVRDVRMVQGGEDFGFALESSQAVAVRTDGLGQHFYCHLALEIDIRGAIDLAHS